jgi:crossover junction endodeoxyribonuclease RuvC
MHRGTSSEKRAVSHGMKVLAIDPGYGRCGMAVLERVGTRDILLHSACIETDATSEFAERLRIVMEACNQLLAEHRPDCLAMEKLFFTANQKTAMRVAEVRGAIIAAAAALRIPVAEYTPGEVKSAAAGWGKADKKQVATMLHALVKIEKPIRHDDEYDAIAVGLTHLICARPHSLTGKKRVTL